MMYLGIDDADHLSHIPFVISLNLVDVDGMGIF